MIIEQNKIIELEHRFNCVNTGVLKNHTTGMLVSIVPCIGLIMVGLKTN